MLRVTVWNEYKHERELETVAKIYPDGIHSCIRAFLQSDEVEVQTATLDMPECGLTEETLAATDVLIWWGHCAHDQVPDEVAQRVTEEVQKGMGLIVLHSGHMSKPFRKLLGTPCTLHWRDDDRERVWCCNPGHPIAAGVDLQFELEQEEMYGEPFGIPNPDDVVFLGWFAGGEVFRSGCTFHLGYGRIFYFQPGHEEYPNYYNPNIQKIITNAVHWAAPVKKIDNLSCVHAETMLES